MIVYLQLKRLHVCTRQLLNLIKFLHISLFFEKTHKIETFYEYTPFPYTFNFKLKYFIIIK